MKKKCSIALAALMALSLTACGSAPTAAPAPSAEAAEPVFEGAWEKEGDPDAAGVFISKEGDTYVCSVQVSTGENKESEWEYQCSYDPETKELGGSGVRTNYEYGADELISSSEVEYWDGAGTFTLDEKGVLVWTDLQEGGDGAMRFVSAQADEEG